MLAFLVQHYAVGLGVLGHPRLDLICDCLTCGLECLVKVTLLSLNGLLQVNALLLYALDEDVGELTHTCKLALNTLQLLRQFVVRLLQLGHFRLLIHVFGLHLLELLGLCLQLTTIVFHYFQDVLTTLVLA